MIDVHKRPDGYFNLTLAEFDGLRYKPEILSTDSKCGGGHTLGAGDVIFTRPGGPNICGPCVAQSGRALYELHKDDSPGDIAEALHAARDQRIAIGHER